MDNDHDDPPFLQIGSFFMPFNFFCKDKLEEAFAYKATKDDIFLVTFPKCGTTWTQYIIWEILNDAAYPMPSTNAMMTTVFPFLEWIGHDVSSMPPPRLIKTHLPFNLNPYNKDAKYVVVVRNPFDACVSFYHHLIVLEPVLKMKVDFDGFYELFMQGKVIYGDYFDHQLSWYSHKDDPNVLFIYYEDMKASPGQYILKIADFLGKEYGEKLRASPGMLDAVIKNTSFSKMKEELYFWHPTSVRYALDDPHNYDDPEKTGKFVKCDFFRKGIVGDWKNHFSEAQKERLWARTLEKFKGTEMLERFEKIILKS